MKPGFFSHWELAECSIAARLCYAGLWLLADSDGRLEDRPRRIKADLFAADSIDVETLLADLAVHGFITRHESDGQRWIEVLGFKGHPARYGKECWSLK